MGVGHKIDFPQPRDTIPLTEPLPLNLIFFQDQCYGPSVLLRKPKLILPVYFYGIGGDYVCGPFTMMDLQEKGIPAQPNLKYTSATSMDGSHQSVNSTHDTQP